MHADQELGHFPDIIGANPSAIRPCNQPSQRLLEQLTTDIFPACYFKLA